MLRSLRIFKRLSAPNRPYGQLIQPPIQCIPEGSKSSVVSKDVCIYRTDESNPLNHNNHHIGKFYTLPNEKLYLFDYGGIPKSYKTQTKTFFESALMVRPTSIEIIEYLKQIDLSKPVPRFCIYGKTGSGKSLSLVHLTHYGSADGYLLIHVPYVSNWTRRPKEISLSTKHQDCYELPLDGGDWLTHFRNQNMQLLKSLNFKTQKEYVWSSRETTPKHSTILDLVEHGINRVKYSCDVISALLVELKYFANQGHCKIMVIIDGFNSFFYPITTIKDSNRNFIHPNRITLTQSFLNITKHDWCNGVVIVTVDEISAKIQDDTSTSYLPKYLLGRSGIEHIDPFIPVECKYYSYKEAKCLLAYYRDRKWIRTEPEHDDEIIAMNANNPYQLMKYCCSL